MNLIKKILSASILAGLSISSAMAADVTGNFQATSTLNSTCKLTAQDISFGTIDLVTTQGTVTANGGIEVLCSKGVNYIIAPNDIFGGSGSEYSNVMFGTGANKDVLSVKLFYGSTQWSRNISASNSITGTGTGAAQAQVIQARIIATAPAKGYSAAATNVFNYQASPDSYSATIVATVTY